MAERYTWKAGAIALVAATAKSVVSFTTPSTRRLWIRKWELTFDGTPNAQASSNGVKCEFFRGVSLTGAVWTATPPTAVATDPAGVAALHTPTWNATTEPTSFAAGVLLDQIVIPPTGGLVVPLPEAPSNWMIGVSSTFVLRLTASVGVNVTIGFELEE